MVYISSVTGHRQGYLHFCTIDTILVHDLFKYVCYRTSLLMLKNDRTLVLLFMTEFLLQEDIVDI